jgi:hypothetical protein
MQNNLTAQEKFLYNKHLATSRRLKNKPFKIKQDFSDIQDTDKHKHLKRLSVFFNKHPEVDLDMFFSAPYKLYPDVAHFGLDYFSTLRAVKSYTTYKKQMFLQDPDSQLQDIKRSLEFIVKFCINNKMFLHQYQYHKTADLYTWMVHYKENKINVYSVMEFANLFSSIKSLAEDVQKFFVGQFVEQFQHLYTKYNISKELKPYMKKTIPILTVFVEKQLTQPKTQVL